MSLTFSLHYEATSSDSTKFNFLLLVFCYLVFLKVYSLVYWLIMYARNLGILFNSEFSVFRCKLCLNFAYFLYETSLRYLFFFCFIFANVHSYSDISLEKLSLRLADAVISWSELCCGYGYPPPYSSFALVISFFKWLLYIPLTLFKASVTPII